METKTYIKMCDCKEIQEQWKLKKGDCFSFVGDIHILADYEIDALNERGTDIDCYNEVVKLMGGHFVDHWNECRDGFTWLPQQDDIQKMMEGLQKPDHLIISLVNFMQDRQRFYKSGKVKKLYPVGSMEQLWLAFYMYEKHKKTWNGKEWGRRRIMTTNRRRK